jgi:glyoxylase-like metal-dependent hydrolase (beta-lactamase superfamily II)
MMGILYQIRRVVVPLILTLLPWSFAAADLKNFCDRLPRAAYAAFEKHESSNDWFEVYEIEPGIFAIYEPFQWQEVISYLITGSEFSLLFDTGNGIGDIKAITNQLTNKPVKVLNSHSHIDHIGGNYSFKTILSPSTEFSFIRSRGVGNEVVSPEVSAEALCKELPQGVTDKNHRIKSYLITEKVQDGDIIDLGIRRLEVLLITGHTDDSIALLDRDAGFLWTGDSLYEGPIWLWAPETDLAAYKASITRLSKLVPQLTSLFPAHNTTRVDPGLITAVERAFAQVIEGKATSRPTWEGVVTFDFKGFGFLMREDYTRLKEH